MLRNTAAQTIGAQLLTAADGSAFTGAVTVYITGDAGTQAVGSVGAGACTHEGQGFHSYAPAQAETNYAHVAFTFIGTGAAPATVQVYTRTGDAFARLGAPVGASISADVAAIKAETASLQTDTNDIQTRIPAALSSGRMDSSVGAMAADVLTAAATAADYVTEVQAAASAAITAASLATAANVAAVEADTQDMQGRLPAALVSGRMDASVGAMAANVMTAAAAASDLTTELQSGLATIAAVATVQSGVTAIDVRLPSDPADQSLVIAATAAIFARIGAPAAASIAADIAAIDAGSGLDAAGVRAAVGLSSANLGAQLAAIAASSGGSTVSLPGVQQSTIGNTGNFTVIRGDDIRLPMRMTENDGITGIDLAGSTIRAQVRTEPNGYLAFEFDVLQTDPADGTVYDETDGEFLLYASHTVTEELTGNDYVWDVEWASAGGIVLTIIEPASFTVIQDVTL